MNNLLCLACAKTYDIQSAVCVFCRLHPNRSGCIRFNMCYDVLHTYAAMRVCMRVVALRISIVFQSDNVSIKLKFAIMPISHTTIEHSLSYHKRQKV